MGRTVEQLKLLEKSGSSREQKQEKKLIDILLASKKCENRDIIEKMKRNEKTGQWLASGYPIVFMNARARENSVLYIDLGENKVIKYYISLLDELVVYKHVV